ncbi:hypothetical protein J7J18_00060, partial [bacterium]|nr:hypothetical protein [bacterium]
GDTMNEKPNLKERILGSKVLRGIFRIQIGGSIIRIWSKDKTIPKKTSVHLFDYLSHKKQ